MTATSGPPQPGSLADLRARQQDRTNSTMDEWKQQQLNEATSFGREYANALSDELRSTNDAFRTGRIEILNQWQRDQESIQTASRQMTRSALAAARLWWLPTVGAVTLLLSATLAFSFWTVTRASQVPAATQTVTKAGQSWEVLTGPNWTNCNYDGRTRPCRQVKE